MRNTLSRNSAIKLRTCNQQIYEAVHYALKFIDIGVADGGRGKKRQNLLYNKRLSNLRWPNSKHNKMPSEAVDLVVFVPEVGYIDERTAPNSYRQYYGYLAGILRAFCYEKGYYFRWGGDWDSDADFEDQTFNDLMHFEITLQE